MELESPPWWKNRRRWFYAGLVTVAVAALLGGWSWYHQNFPLPKRLANSSIQLHQIHDRLIRWKFARDLRGLQLEGTIWEDLLTGGVAEFGAYGVFSWKTLPSKKRHISKVHDEPEFASLIDGAAYRFDPAKGLLYWNDSTQSLSFEEPNLDFPGKHWIGYLGFDGSRLALSVRMDTTILDPGPFFLMTFDRRVSP